MILENNKMSIFQERPHSTFYRRQSRESWQLVARNLLIALTVTVLVLLVGCEAERPMERGPAPSVVATAAYQATIVAVGDNLTAGLGVV
jgi:hypothetical protein